MDALIRFPAKIVGNFARWLGYRGDRRFVAWWWECSGDELAFCDGERMAAGMANNHHWIRFMSEGEVLLWRIENGHINLGNSDFPETHWFIIDTEKSVAYVAPKDVAKLIVRRQSLDEEDKT